MTKIHIEPSIIERPAVRYLGVTRPVTMTTFAIVADRIPDLIGTLIGQGTAITDAPFFRYRVIDMERQLIVDAGVPIGESEVELTDDLFIDELPAGRYATVTHTGVFDELIDVTTALLEWADDRGLQWDRTDGPHGDEWGCRLEIYLTNPAEEPDPSKFVTQLAFRLAD